MTHDQLQSTCAMWFWNSYPNERLMWHHNVATFATREKGSMMKSLGVVAGIWDFEWTTPRGWYVWIDFKVGRDRLSEKQEEFREKLLGRSRLTFFFVVENLETFKDIVWKNI